MIRIRNPVEHSEGDMADVCFAEISEEYTKHSQKKPRAALKAIEKELRERIRLYIQHRGDPAQLGPSPFSRTKSVQNKANKKNANSGAKKSAGDYLFDRYRSGNETDSVIVDHAKRVSVGFCPYCSMSMRRKAHGVSLDRDHILPRSAYPEFSLLRVNLIIACDGCNDAKKSAVFDDAGQWKWVHPYFDSFLAIPLLAVVLSYSNNSITPKFAIREDLPLAIKERVKRHFRYMDLKIRYADDPLRELTNIVEAHRGLVQSVDDVPRSARAFMRQGFQMVSLRPNDPLGHALIALGRSADLNKILGL